MSQKPKPRVLLINSYDMNMVRAGKLSGELPSHHMFGAFELERDYGVKLVIPTLVKYTWINRIGRWLDIDFFDQQLRCLFLLHKCDVIYAPYAATNTKFLVILKLLGLMRKPLIILVHQPLFGSVSQNRWKKSVVKKLIQQYDRIIFFSSKMRDEIVGGYGFDDTYCKLRFQTAQWGIDLEYFRKFRRTGSDAQPVVFSSGNTGRDFDILIRVARNVNTLFKIYCKPESLPDTKDLPSNVTLLSGEFPFENICNDQADSCVVAIPILRGTPGMIGYTSLLDALALGKPVIMTRNPYIDVDIEAAGVGVTVDVDDDEAWQHAIVRITADRELRRESAVRSEKLGDEVFGIGNLARKLAETIHQLLK